MAKNKIQPNLCLETFFELPIKNGDVIKHNLAVHFFFCQVREIRRLLRTKSLGGVQVEGVNNVQGENISKSQCA